MDRRRYAKNPEKYIEIEKQRYRKTRETCPEKLRAKGKAYRDANLEKMREYAARWISDARIKRDATRAAALLTETLGVPHVAVETVDPKTGRKDWQPKPKGELE